MCYQETTHYRCGHRKEHEVRKCRKYGEKKKAERGNLLRQFIRNSFSHTARHCGDLQSVNHDITTVCSPTCVQTREAMRKRQLMESHERAKATAREYRRRKDEEERKAKKGNGKSRLPLPILKRTQAAVKPLWEAVKDGTTAFTRGTSRQPVAQHPQQPQQPDLRRRNAQNIPNESRIKPPWEIANGGTLAYTGGASRQPVATQPQQPNLRRSNAQRIPNEGQLADRHIRPQAYHSQNLPAAPHSRTQANIGPQGRQAQVPQSQPRMPFSPSTNGPNPSSRRQPQRSTTEDPQERRMRFEANQFPTQVRTERKAHPVQPVTARRQVAVSHPTNNIPQPSQARISHGSRGPPVPPKDPWRPHHPSMAPAPLTPRPKQSAAGPSPLHSARPMAASRGYSSDIPAGYRRQELPPRTPSHTTRTVPEQMPFSSWASSQPGTTVPEYRPNPVFTNRRQGVRPAGASAAAATASSSARQQPSSSRSRPQPSRGYTNNTNTGGARRPAPAPIPSRSTTKPAKKRNWFKKLVSPPSSDSSVEWVSQDAARIERGGSSRRG